MVAGDNLHSRVVSWLKVILPLTALALMATLFLVARTGPAADKLPFSKRALEEMAREQHVEGPDFAGTTEEGRAIEISARVATPRLSDHNIVDAEQVSGRMETGNGGAINVASNAGTVFVGNSSAKLEGAVTIITSTGYTINTEELTTSLNQTEMETEGEVSAQGPLGRIDAGKLVVTPASDNPEDVTVVFKSGVKLIYVPQNQ